MQENRARKWMVFVLALLLIVPGMLALIMMPFVIAFGSSNWAWASLRSFDRWCHAVIVNGFEFHTISASAWEHRDTLIGKTLVWFLNFFEKNHCRAAWMAESIVYGAGKEYVKNRNEHNQPH